MLNSMKRTSKGPVILAITSFTVIVCVYHYAADHSLVSSTAENVFCKERLSTKTQNVFFLETSGKGTLGLRQLASVESAARFIPNANVVVFIFSDDNYTTNPYMTALEEKHNVQFTWISKRAYIANTPLQPWYDKGIWKKSPHMISHTSDALRFLTLWKFGGIYLDLDVIMINAWKVDYNVVVVEDENLLSSAILGFTRKHPVILDCINWLNEHYDPNLWGANGPLLITNMARRYLQNSLNKDDITILPRSTFNVIGYRDFKMFFDPSRSEEVLERTKVSFGIHFWNKFSENIPLVKDSSDAYHLILRKSCPIIYEAMENS